MEKEKQKLITDTKDTNTLSVLIPSLCILMGYLFWRFILGNASGFSTPDKSGSWFWPAHKGPIGPWYRMYEGGIIVPLLIGLLFIVVVFSIERYLTFIRSKGKLSNKKFIKKIHHHLSNKDLKAALEECNIQKGSLGNIIHSGLSCYQKMIINTHLTPEKKIKTIEKEIEEATALELPILEKNLSFLSTITSLATLIALLGTVVGMIRSFAALGEGAGAAGASELAVGISEALYNTATGIAASALALVMYNIFSSKIDSFTQVIDESTFMLTQNFNSLYK